MPLVYKVTRKRLVEADAIYKKYRNVTNDRVDMTGWKTIFVDFLGAKLNEEEAMIFEAYLAQIYNGTSELKLGEVTQFFATNIRHKSLGGGDKKEAEKALHGIKHACESKNKPLDLQLQKAQNDLEKLDNDLNLRSFKLFVKDLVPAMTSYAIENLMHFMDEKSTGFINCVDLKKLCK